MLETRDKSIIMRCNHCDNKTTFIINGELEYKLYPSEEEFSKIDQYRNIELEDLPDDEDSRMEIISNYVSSLCAQEQYIKGIHYHQKQTLLVKCISCCRPSVINIGKNITEDELRFDPYERQDFSFSDVDNTLQYYDIDLLLYDGYFIDLLYPTPKLTPKPSAKMPWKVAQMFEEARVVYNSSPRASAALLRLALQILLIDLGLPADKDIYEHVGILVKHELIRETQEALDIIRVFGNNAVHPGEINMDENAETVLKLFDLVNFVVDRLITRRDTIKEMYSQLPEEKRKGIEQRDNKK